MPETNFKLCSLSNIGKGAEFKPFSNPFSRGSDSAIDFSTTNPSPCLNDDFLTTTPMVDSFSYSKLPMDSQCEFFETKNNKNVNINAETKGDTNTTLPMLQTAYNQDKGKALAKTTLPTLQTAYNQDKGRALANIAVKHAVEKNSKHQCLQGVRESLTKAGLVKGSMGISAYQAASVLAKNNKFKEIAVAKEDLKQLPAGCIIVWDKNNGGSKSADKNGHIAITVGDGREACDHVADSLYMFNSKHRVFVPVGIDKSF